MEMLKEQRMRANKSEYSMRVRGENEKMTDME